jgi:predicted transcriptional regulator
MVMVNIVMYYMKEKNTEKKVMGILKRNLDGATITDLVKLSGLSRSTIRVVLARLEGRRDINYRNIGMAKVYAMGEVRK